jgi:hypothetical protein
MDNKKQSHRNLLMLRLLLIWAVLTFVILFLWMAELINKKSYYILWVAVTLYIVACFYRTIS